MSKEMHPRSVDAHLGFNFSNIWVANIGNAAPMSSCRNGSLVKNIMKEEKYVPNELRTAVLAASADAATKRYASMV